MKLFSCLLFFCLYFSLSLQAQDYQSFDLGEVLIESDKKDIVDKIDFKQVDVIDSNQLDSSGANSATAVLDNLPSVFVQKTSAYGRADVVIRGLGNRGRRIAVVVDGHLQRMGLYGCTITHMLSLDNTDQIHLLKGPASLEYGSGALAGAVEITTKKPRRKNEGSLLLFYGSNQSMGYRLRQGGRNAKFYYYATVSKRQSDGSQTNSAYRDRNFTLKLGKKISDHSEVIFNTQYFKGFKQEPEPSPSSTWNEYQRGYFNLSLINDSRWGKQIYNIYRNFGEHIFSNNFHAKDYTQALTIKNKNEISFSNNLLTGITLKEQGGKIYSGPGVDLGTYNRYLYSLFFSDHQSFLNEQFIVKAGVRYSRDSDEQGATANKAELVWHCSPTVSLLLSRRRGFRYPQLNELYFLPVANPDLELEKTTNYEFGINYRPNNKLNFHANYFLLKAEDFISVSKGKFKNVDNLKFKGTELILGYKATKGLKLSCAYSYIDYGSHTQGRAQDKLDLSLLYTKPRYKINVNANYISDYFAQDDHKQRLPDFFLVGANFIYNLLPGLELNLEINNVFNVEHKLYVDLPSGSAGVYRQPGRTFLIGLQYKW
jgi:outer membrane receptor protein involved in Fe transport